MPRNSSSAKARIRALQDALAAEGIPLGYTTARRVWEVTTDTVTEPDPSSSWTAVPSDELTWDPVDHGHLLILGSSAGPRDELRDRLIAQREQAGDTVIEVDLDFHAPGAQEALRKIDQIRREREGSLFRRGAVDDTVVIAPRSRIGYSSSGDTKADAHAEAVLKALGDLCANGRTGRTFLLAPAANMPMHSLIWNNVGFVVRTRGIELDLLMGGLKRGLELTTSDAAHLIDPDKVLVHWLFHR